MASKNSTSLSLQLQSLDDNDIATVPVVELHAAVTDGNLTKLETILDQSLDRYGVDLVSQYHLLHTAASCGQVATVRLLITKYNWPVDYKNEKEQTPLHVACGSGHLDVIRVLFMEYKADLNVRDKQNDIPLHIAARHGRIDVIKCLVDEFDCDPSTIGCEGRTILHYACYEGHIELVKVLIKQYLMNPLSNDDNGNNSLHYAVRGGREKIVRIISTNYNNIRMAMDCRNRDGESAFDVACSCGHLHIARLFVIKYGFKQSAGHGDNLLRVAVRYGQTDTVSCLIDKFGYDLNTKGRDGMTILQFAYHEEQLKVVELLITRYMSKGDINTVTLLHYVVSKGQAKVIKLILTKLNGLIDCRNRNQQSPLHIACIAGHVDIIKILVTEHGADLNARDHSNNTPLHTAAIHGQTAVVDALIKDYGCDPISKGFNGVTALHHACHQGHAALMETLISFYQLDPMSTDDDGNTPLHYAALAGRETVVKQLISKYSCPVDYTNKNNETPLHLACDSGHLKVIQMLILECKADLNVRNEDNDTPLHIAALRGHLHIINYIIINRLGYISSTQLQGKKERYIILLHRACRQGHMEVIESLLTYSKLDPLSIDDDGNTLVHLAAMGGSKTVVKMLVTKYGCPVSSKNNTGQSPLHLACTSSHTQVITTLLSECKADLFVRDNIMNYTPLHRAVHRGQIDIMKCLIDSFGIDVTRTDGSNLLHFACEEGLVKAVRYIMTKYKLRKKVTREIVKIGDHNGNTPLHYSALGGKIEVATLLITEYGAPVNHPNNKNETPLHLACTKGHLGFIQLLVTEYRADTNACDINNHTPLQRVALNGHTKVVYYFIKELNCSADFKGTDGCNLLHLACQQGHLGLIEYLSTEFDSMIQESDNNGNIPLHYAALGGNSEVATLLISRYHSPVNHQNNKTETPLHLACIKGHLTFIQTLVKKHKADINTFDINNHTPLLSAAFNGQAEVVKCFIMEFNCSTDVKGINGCSLLHFACQQGHLNLVKQLVTDYKLDPNILDDYENTPLHYAALGGKIEIATLLITKYGSPVSPLNNKRETPLHLACTNAHLMFIAAFIGQHKADINACDINNHTPLQRAVFNGQVEVVDYFINELKCNAEIKGSDGCRLLHLACQQGHLNLVNQLVTDYNLDPNTRDEYENTPLHYAALGGKIEIATLLITKYNSLVSPLNSKKESPLHLACNYGHLVFLKTLIGKHNLKAAINARDINNHTPLQRAVLNGQAEVVKCFITEFNCSTDVKGTDGCSLLHLACQQGHLNLVEQLVTDYKLDPNIRDDYENTPLHYAALGDKIEIATLLITKYNSLVSPLNNKGETPLHLACTNIFITTLVGKHKAYANACDINNHTPLQRAALNGQTEVVDCFIKELNCSADSKGTDGCSLMHLACQQGRVELIEHLVTNYKLDSMIQESDNDGNIPLHYAALDGNSELAMLLISKYHSPVNHRNNKSETPLHLACIKGHLTFIQTLVEEHEADIKVIGFKGRNPLHYACLNDQDDLAQILINAFNFSVVATDTDGNSPLHISAIHGKHKCVYMLLHAFHAPVYLRNGSGKSALEVASDGNTRNIIETYLKGEHDRIQDDYKQIQILSSKKYSGAQRLTRVFVLGYKQSGKSTLIESLKRQNFFSSFKQVSEAIVPPHTSGIIPSEYRHKSIGRVLYYDFAGDPEYYSSHSAIMSSVLQSKQGTNVFLVLVDFQKDNKHVFEELGYWFGFISYHCAKLKENSCKVLVIGSHIDLITKQEATRKAVLVSEFTHKYFSLSSEVPAIEIVKGKNDLIINCCNPRSSTCVHHTLNQIVKRASTYRLSVEAAIILGLFEKDFKGTVTCRIQTLLTHITETGIHLPNAAESIYPKIMELHNIGLLMIIVSKSGKVEDYLLLLNISKLTNEVHKLLFSKDSAETFPLSTDPHSTSMGILPQTYLSSILPEYITTECLIELQYCQEFSHAEVKSDETYSVTPSEDPNAEPLLYFPSLCETERRENIIRIPEDYKCLGWYLKCGKTFDYLPPRFLHVLLLRLAHAFALPAAYDPSSMGDDDVLATLRLFNRRCTMWKNGIHWLMEEGVECFVEMINKSKGIIVVTKSEVAQITTCTKMLFEIIRKIHQAKEEFCETISLQEYYLHVNDSTPFIDVNELDSDDPITSTGDSLFLSSNISRVLKDSKESIISAHVNGRTSLKVTKVSCLQEYVHWGKC